MNKSIFIGTIVAVVMALVVTGYAYAQNPTPTGQDAPAFGPGMRGGRGSGMGMHGGWGGSQAGAENPLRIYMQAALAESFGLTTDQLESLHAEDQTLWQYAADQGLSTDEFNAKMSAARTAALQAAVADGVITQEQVDWMQQRMGQRGSMSNGQCTGMGSGGRGGGKWQEQTPQP